MEQEFPTEVNSFYKTSPHKISSFPGSELRIFIKLSRVK